MVWLKPFIDEIESECDIRDTGTGLRYCQRCDLQYHHMCGTAAFDLFDRRSDRQYFSDRYLHSGTDAFVPKIVAVFLGMLIFGAFILTTLTDYMTELWTNFSTFLG